MSDPNDDLELDAWDRRNRFRAAYRAGAEVAVNGRVFRVTNGERTDGSGGRFVVQVAPAAAGFDGRAYALKVSPAGPDDRGADEAAVLARLDHPHVLRFVDAERTPTATHILTEWCDGGTLADYWEEVGTPARPAAGGRPAAGWAAVTVRDILGMFLGVIDGVAHAHGRGEYHLDLKPANVLVKTVREEPLAKVSDFDVSRARGMGTPEFVAPGQGHMDPRARFDVIGLGHTLRAVLRGGPANGPRPPHLGRELWRLLRKAVATDSSGYPTAADFKAAVERHLGRGRRRLRRAAVGGVVAALAAACGLASVGWASAADERDRVAHQSVTHQEMVDELGAPEQLRRIADPRPDLSNEKAVRQLLALLRRAYDQTSLPGVGPGAHALWRGRGYAALGDTYRHIGDYQEAIYHYKLSIEVLRDAVARDPDSDSHRRELVGSLRGQASTQRQQSRSGEDGYASDLRTALGTCDEACAEAGRLIGNGFDNRKAVAMARSSRALVLSDLSAEDKDPARRAEANDLFGQTIDEWRRLRDDAAATEDRVQLAREYNNRANHYRRWGEYDRAADDHREGLRVLDENARREPDKPILFAQTRAQHRHGLGICLTNLDKPAAAREELNVARDLRAKLHARHGGAPLVAADLASTYNELGNLELKEGRRQEALTQANAGLEVVVYWPNVTRRVVEMKLKLLDLKAKALTKLGRTTEAATVREEHGRLQKVK